MRVRAAVAEDWDDIWPFWQQIVEAGDTYAYPLGATSEQARGWWFDGSHVVVCEEEDVVLGSAKMGPNRPGRGAHIGTASFMVDDRARGRGVGRLLGEYCLGWHRDAGFAGIQFNAVVESNVAAVELWLALGFRIVGTVPRAFDSATHGRVGLHVMHLDLSETATRPGPEPVLV